VRRKEGIGAKYKEGLEVWLRIKKVCRRLLYFSVMKLKLSPLSIRIFNVF